MTSQNTKMETSTEKTLPVSNRSCNLLSKAVKRVDKFQQSYQPETCSNLDLVRTRLESSNFYIFCKYIYIDR